ncbi:MAG: hypothetical protein KKH04_18100 [Proteobacteria bacterium]|nr:hypothetical protein [Pseudomonadota bacterium]
MKFDLLIQGGKLVIPKQGIVAGDIGIQDGRISAILKAGNDLPATP